MSVCEVQSLRGMFFNVRTVHSNLLLRFCCARVPVSQEFQIRFSTAVRPLIDISARRSAMIFQKSRTFFNDPYDSILTFFAFSGSLSMPKSADVAKLTGNGDADHQPEPTTGPKPEVSTEADKNGSCQRQKSDESDPESCHFPGENKVRTRKPRSN